MSNVEYCDPAAPIDSGQIIAEPEVRRAGFWIRLAAWVVDCVCLFLVTTALTFAALTTIYLGGQLGGEINDQVIALAGYTSAAIVLLSGVAYFTLFIGSCGQTPGKMLCRLKVIRLDGLEMTYGRAWLRAQGWMLSFLLFGLGFLLIPCSRHKRALHDILAGTVVIRLPRASSS